LAAYCGLKDCRQLQRGRYTRRDGFDNFPAMSSAPGGLSGDNALGPPEADLVEIEVGMFRTDMVEDAGDCAPDP
jgi:hypothetical protein